MVTATSPNRTPHEFRSRDFRGGHPVIDFVNTVTARNTTAPEDWLDSYATLLRWASLSALTIPAGAATVEADRADAQTEMRRCRELREALHATMTAVLDDVPVPRSAAATLQANWRHAATHVHLELSSTPFRLRHDQPGPALSVVRRTLTAAAVELLIDLPRERIRRCPGERCGWIFLDTSKAGRRRWCDMATCGTADKNRRRQPSP
ncbi:CGNR zinc finger domain-containing protein [Rugosimonospora acidiphila]|uniref:CGNR zinc finger domain-containing protein n=1 Tax=Rugosimonospora acidiphila TaxID=556531 RepID=A0ABP9RUI2_9ACTN